MAGLLSSMPVYLVPRSFAAQPVYLDEQSRDLILQELVAELSVALYGEYNVKMFGALGDGITDDTAAIQAAIDAAEAYVALNDTAAIVYFPPGKYRVSSTIHVQEDAIWLRGVGGGGDIFAKSGSCLVPTEDFADDTYVLSFDVGSKTRTLYGNKLTGLNIFIEDGDIPQNTFHGLLWQVAKGLVMDVVIDQMPGRGCGVLGYNASWSTLYSTFYKVQFRRSGTDGCAFLGFTADMFFTNVIFGASGSAGLRNPGSCTLFTACHMTGNETNVKFDGASVEAGFLNCVFETPRKTNIDVDCTDGTIVRAKFIGCQLDSSNLDTNDAYSSIWVHRNSGGNTATVIIMGCTFASTGEGTANEPEYHINLAGAVAVGCRVSDNDFQANSSVKGNINHSSSAVRCTVNGLGRNAGDPASTGNWLNNGEEGIRVWNTTGSTFHTFAAGSWRSG